MPIIYRLEPVTSAALARTAAKAGARFLRSKLPRSKATWQRDIAEFTRKNPPMKHYIDLHGERYAKQQVKLSEKPVKFKRSKPYSQKAHPVEAFKKLNPKLKALAVGAPLTYAAVSFAPIPQSLADAIAENTDENKQDPFDVKTAVSESQNIWEIRKVLQLRDEARKRGITSELIGGKVPLDVRTIPLWTGESGSFNPNTSEVMVTGLTLPQAGGDILARLGLPGAQSLTPGGVLAHELGHAWHHLGTQTSLTGKNVAPPVRDFVTENENKAYRESVAETFEQLTRKYQKKPITSPSQLEDWGFLRRVNYGAGSSPEAGPWTTQWNQAQADVLGNMQATKQLKLIRDSARA